MEICVQASGHVVKRGETVEQIRPEGSVPLLPIMGVDWGEVTCPVCMGDMGTASSCNAPVTVDHQIWKYSKMSFTHFTSMHTFKPHVSL